MTSGRNSRSCYSRTAPEPRFSFSLATTKGTCTDLDTQVALPKGAVRGSTRHRPEKVGIDLDHLLHGPRCCEKYARRSRQQYGHQSVNAMVVRRQNQGQRSAEPLAGWYNEKATSLLLSTTDTISQRWLAQGNNCHDAHRQSRLTIMESKPIGSNLGLASRQALTDVRPHG